MRREEGEYPLWSLSDEQQSTRQKSAQPFGLGGAGASPAREERQRLEPSLTRLASHPAALPTLLSEPQTWCTSLCIPSQEATQTKPGGNAYADSWQSRVFVKRFRGLAEFSTAMGRQLPQFSEKSGCSLLKNGHFDGLRFQG